MFARISISSHSDNAWMYGVSIYYCNEKVSFKIMVSKEPTNSSGYFENYSTVKDLKITEGKLYLERDVVLERIKEFILNQVKES